MSRFLALLAVPALALAIWQTLEGQARQEEVRALRSEVVALRATVSGRAREGDPGELAAPDVRLAEGTEHRASADAEGTEDGPRLLARGASPAVLAEAVRELQGRVAAQEERVSEVAEKVETAARHGPRFNRRSYLQSVDDAVRQLSLDPTQRADLERVVEYAKEDIERLYSIPNAEGKTFDEVNEPVRIGGDGQGFAAVFTNLQKVQEFKNSTVPGRNETYAQAEARIREDAKRDARALLDPEQQKTWDESYTDGLFGSRNGGAISISTVTTSTASSK